MLLFVVAALVLVAAGAAGAAAGAGSFLYILAGSLCVLFCPCPRCSSGYKKLGDTKAPEEPDGPEEPKPPP